MSIPYTFPWGLHPMEDWISKEFNRRVQEKGMSPTQTENGIYSGPKTAWARVFSNGISSLAFNGAQGFVMGGTEGFDASYGFTENGRVTIGVDATGKPHEIDASGRFGSIINNSVKTNTSDFPHRPPPSLVSIETQFAGGANSSFNALCRKTTINWKCYSLGQLEYLTPYFLTPRITCLVEWGWNHYDTTSLVDLNDVDWLYEIFLGKWEYTGKWIEHSRGNYDLAMGIVTDYTISLNEFGGYDCSTTITNANYLLEGQSYQNKTASSTDKSTKKPLKIKDFNEFVFYDLDNLEIKARKGSERSDSAKTYSLDTKGKIFKHDGERWLRMDLIEDIINIFFGIEFLNNDDKPVNVECMKLDISKVPICAHPFLKSVNKDVLFPNQIAPRFVSDSGESTSVLNAAQSGEYLKLFPDAEKIVSRYKLDMSYDNLLDIINKGGRSFPMFVPYTDNGSNNAPSAGYWGYLSDVFVSAKLFKSLVGKNDTALKLLEELLQHISKAMCDITQMQPRPSIPNGAKYTVIDTNFTTIRTTEDANRLPKISLMSNNSSFIRAAEFSVKLSGEMANQMVMQSAVGGSLPDGYGTSYVDTKTMEVSKFSKGDRMFKRGVIPQENTKPSNKSEEEKKIKFDRKFTPQGENKNFYIYKDNSSGTTTYHILSENNPSFIKTVLSDTEDKRAVYTNNAIMPGTNFTMELLGIGGITFLSQFTLDHVPSAYNYERCVWQVSDVKQKIENKVWITTVTAQARPLTSI